MWSDLTVPSAIVASISGSGRHGLLECDELHSEIDEGVVTENFSITFSFMSCLFMVDYSRFGRFGCISLCSSGMVTSSVVCVWTLLICVFQSLTYT